MRGSTADATSRTSAQPSAHASQKRYFPPQIPHHAHYNASGRPYYGSRQSSWCHIMPFTKEQHNSWRCETVNGDIQNTGRSSNMCSKSSKGAQRASTCSKGDQGATNNGARTSQPPTYLHNISKFWGRGWPDQWPMGKERTACNITRWRQTAGCKHKATMADMNADARLHVPNNGNTRLQSTVYTCPSSITQVSPPIPVQLWLQNTSTATSSSTQKNRTTWSQSSGKEIRQLATTTETIVFINKHQIPKDCQGDVTYGRIVCDMHKGKKDKHCTRLTMGSNLINYPGDCRTPMANLLTVKILLNSIILMPNAKFMTINIKDFYLITPIEW